MASGRPVVAFGRGGATETVVEGLTGTFFAEQTVEAISAAVGRLADMKIDPGQIAAHADQFGREQFFRKMRSHIDGLLAKRAGAR
jgi:glycosyltransferase involved in cell wall biosynthesis